jgi:hypothetical protein
MRMTLMSGCEIDLSTWEGGDQLSRNDMAAVHEMIRRTFDDGGVEAYLDVWNGQLKLAVGLPLAATGEDRVWFEVFVGDLLSNVIPEKRREIVAAIKALT